MILIAKKNENYQKSPKFNFELELIRKDHLPINDKNAKSEIVYKWTQIDNKLSMIVDKKEKLERPFWLNACHQSKSTYSHTLIRIYCELLTFFFWLYCISSICTESKRSNYTLNIRATKKNTTHFERCNPIDVYYWVKKKVKTQTMKIDFSFTVLLSFTSTYFMKFAFSFRSFHMYIHVTTQGFNSIGKNNKRWNKTILLAFFFLWTRSCEFRWILL